jgi:hypothetical protein
MGHVRSPRWRQRTHDLLVEAIDQACAPIRNQPHLASLAGLESHRGSRGYIQATPASGLSIECQGCIGLREMVMTSNLDRPVTRVGNSERDCDRARVQDDLTRRGEHFSRNHVNLQ